MGGRHRRLHRLAEALKHGINERLVQQHRQQPQEAIGAEGPGEGQQPEGIGELGRQHRHRQHKDHQQGIGRGCGERRQPLTLALRQGSIPTPASGQGLAGSQGTWRQLDALPQLAAEAEGGSGTEQRQGAGDGGGVERGLCVGEGLTMTYRLVEGGI